jgi:hypothetical protein
MKQEIKINASDLKKFLGLHEFDCVTDMEYELVEDMVVFNVGKFSAK